MKSPFISVIIPVRELSEYLISENLPAFTKQAYNHFEVIVLPNKKNSTDSLLLKKYPWLRIISTKKVTRPADKRNIGVRHAKGEIIAFIDDDAYPTPGWLKTALKSFTSKKIVAVCGPGILPPQANFWEKIFDEVLKTWIGSGGYAYRFIGGKKRYVDDFPSMNFFVLKKEFNTVGGFKNDYWPGEDSKLCVDLVYKRHGRIVYTPEVLSYHHRRNNFLGYLEQHGNYGFHRGAFFAHGDRNSQRLSYIIPTLFVLYLLISTIYHPSSTIYFPLLIYFLFMFYLLFRSFLNTKNIFIALFSPIVLFLTHLTYGILFMKGFVKGLVQKERIYS
ncbi:glycosyltransferase [Candidatus Roizmanbacteria bacterium]|nr:glycosyltransferase [Candidatus Roizmanbacteria bacterium]